VQRRALGDREDGDMLGQPGLLQIQEPGVLTLRRWKRPANSRIDLPGPIFHRPHPPWKGRQLDKAKTSFRSCWLVGADVGPSARLSPAGLMQPHLRSGLPISVVDLSDVP
jgi:hypothetical protein